jgi:hypothetical protein
MSSVDEEEEYPTPPEDLGKEPQVEGFQEPGQAEREREFAEREGGAGDSDVQLPG